MNCWLIYFAFYRLSVFACDLFFPGGNPMRTKIVQQRLQKKLFSPSENGEKHSKRLFYVIQAIQIVMPENAIKKTHFTANCMRCSDQWKLCVHSAKITQMRCISRDSSRNPMRFQSTAQSEIDAFTVRLINNNRLKCQIDVCAIIFVLNVS